MTQCEESFPFILSQWSNFDDGLKLSNIRDERTGIWLPLPALLPTVEAEEEEAAEDAAVAVEWAVDLATARLARRLDGVLGNFCPAAPPTDPLKVTRRW